MRYYFMVLSLLWMRREIYFWIWDIITIMWLENSVSIATNDLFLMKNIFVLFNLTFLCNLIWNIEEKRDSVNIINGFWEFQLNMDSQEGSFSTQLFCVHTRAVYVIFSSLNEIFLNFFFAKIFLFYCVS